MIIGLILKIFIEEKIEKVLFNNKNTIKMSSTIRLTQENSRKYVGYDIVFRIDSPGTKRIVCRNILRVSRT